jgi:hypothetical protein
MRYALRVVSATFLGLILAVSGVGKEKAGPAAPASVPAYKVGILPFQDMSGSEYGEQLKQVLAKQLQAAILNSSKLTPRFMKPGGDNPEQTELDVPYAVKLGKFYKSDLVVLGSLLSAEVEDKENSMSGPSFGGISLGGKSHTQDATVVLQAEIVDVGRGEKLNSLRATGKQHESKVSSSISTGYGSMDMGGTEFQKTTLGKATQKAIDDLVRQLVAEAQRFTPAAAVSAEATGAAGGTASSSCHVLFRVMLSASMETIKDYTITVNGADLSAQVKAGVLQIDGPTAKMSLQVKPQNPPEGAQLQPAYESQVACSCDKPEKVLVLEIDADGQGKFNWWQ